MPKEIGAHVCASATLPHDRSGFVKPPANSYFEPYQIVFEPYQIVFEPYQIVFELYQVVPPRHRFPAGGSLPPVGRRGRTRTAPDRP